jgi:hypothetical protein
MFGGLEDMWEFIGQAPYFIATAFAGSFLLTFTVAKLSQSEAVYQWFTTRLDVWRAKQARTIRQSMTADVTAFLRDRREDELSPKEQHIYYAMLDSYFEKIEKLYKSSQDMRSKDTEKEDEL